MINFKDKTVELLEVFHLQSLTLMAYGYFLTENNLVFLQRHIKFICTYVNFQDMNSEFEFNNSKKYKAQEEHKPWWPWLSQGQAAPQDRRTVHSKRARQSTLLRLVILIVFCVAKTECVHVVLLTFIS